ncbi:MAG: ATP-binding protein [Acidobacteria bacterium]|nr:ATP-binding protein [Acidobacteriota bacterium]
MSRSAKAFLEVVTSDGKRTIPLSDHPITLGRAADCDVVIAEPFVSACHARIEPAGKGYVVRDAGSTNGTWVDSASAKDAVRLKSGASLVLGQPGNYKVRFIIEAEEPKPEPASEAAGTANENLLEVLEISKVLLSTLELEDVLGRVLDACVRVTHAERGYLFLHEGGDLKLRARRDDQQDPSSAQQVEFSRSIAVRVAATGRAEFLSDLEGKSPRDKTASIVRLRLQNIACVPLKIQERIIGIVYLDSHHRAAIPDRTGREVLAVLAGLAAVAIENARMVEERLQNERWSTIGRMAASIVHDIRSPMAALRGTAELLRNKIPEPAHKEKLNVIIGEVDRLTKLSSEMLEFSSGAQPLKLESVSLTAVVQAFLKTVEPQIEQHKILLQSQLNLEPPLSLDRQKIVRVLHNVVGNALEALKPGGTLTVETSARADRAVLAISDNGCGMAPDTAARVCEPFFSHGKERGSGLGMAIVRRIAEQHGATLSIQSAPGQGTRVEFLFPMSVPATASR